MYKKGAETRHVANNVVRSPARLPSLLDTLEGFSVGSWGYGSTLT